MQHVHNHSLDNDSMHAVRQWEGACCVVTACMQHISRCQVLTFSPRGFSGTEIGAPTMNLRGALLGKGVMPHRPTTR